MRTGVGISRVIPASPSAPSHVTVETEEGESFTFDAVVLATHSDTSLQLLQADAPEVSSTWAMQPFERNRMTYNHLHLRRLAASLQTPVGKLCLK